MARAAILLVLLVACGRFDFDRRAIDGGLAPRIPWHAPEMWMVQPGGDDPSLTGDLLELYINHSSTDIDRATRPTTADPWTPSSIVPELDVTQDQSTPEVTPDGLTMYFSSTRTGSLGGNDIWLTTRAGPTDAWGAPVLVTELSSPNGEHPGNMTADQLHMVFDSRRGGRTDEDIFVATRPTIGDLWATPVAIAEVNVNGFNDESPHISSDGLELYFDSTRSGLAKLYVAQRARITDPFGAPEQLAELDTGEAQFDPWVSPDGHDLVFMSNGLWHATR